MGSSSPAVRHDVVAVLQGLQRDGRPHAFSESYFSRERKTPRRNQMETFEAQKERKDVSDGLTRGTTRPRKASPRSKTARKIPRTEQKRETENETE